MGNAAYAYGISHSQVDTVLLRQDGIYLSTKTCIQSRRKIPAFTPTCAVSPAVFAASGSRQ